MQGSSFTLVSDLDDTLKISHTTNHLRTVFRGLFMHQAYSGMAELLQEWTGGKEFIVLSSSPRSIRKRVERFLKRHHFPSARIWLRDWFRQTDIRKYKGDNLKRLLREAPGPYIFLGDDSEWDPEVFSQFRQEHPEKVLAIYIRRMRGRPLPEGVIPFHTAFEIAYAELRANRLKIPQVSRIGKAILEQKNPDLIIPYFAVSPSGLDLDIHPQLQNIQNSLHVLLSKIHDVRIGEQKR